MAQPLPLLRTDPAHARLERALRERVSGEVRFDAKTRLLYSTDASIYQILPVGVVLPRSTDDVVAAVTLAAEFGVPVLPRGGGTALAGQTVGAAVVLDFTKHMDRVLSIDPDGRRARVQPGVRLDRLNRAAAPYGLHFGPDPATIRQCALGGMIGNNSCGARSLVYGKTGDHVHSLDCVLADGRCAHFAAAPREVVATLPGLEGEIARRVLAILEPHRARIAETYPKIPRRVSGYNFDAILEDPALNLARLIVGSEGTLATVVEAEVGLVPVPAARALVLLSFAERFTAFDAVPEILRAPGLAALEIVDSRVLRGAREIFEFRPTAAMASPDALGVLFCEFSADTADAAADLAHAFAGRAGALPGRPTPAVYLSARDQAAAWALRQAATGLLYLTTPTKDIKPTEFVEDTGIPPERLGAYTRRFEEVVRRHGTTTGFFGHAGQGCLHIRVDLDLKRGEDVRRMQAIARDIAELVVEFGGSLSGEHGDGLARSEFLPLMFGDDVMELHRRVKDVFDPEGRMNPGKIVPPVPSMSESLRFGEGYRNAAPPTWFDYPVGGWDVAVEQCNGMGVCRKLDAGTMCPSYMVTQEEQHATRGRANALREAMRGGLPGMASTEVLEALDLCLACKACRTECPVGVDMARYKAEFLAQHHRATGRVPRSAQAFGRIHELARRASAAPGVANLGSRLLGGAMKRALDVDPRRALPTFAAEPFRRWLRRRPAPAAAGDGRPVAVLLDDTFHTFFGPGPLRAAVTVLERAGFRVKVPEAQVCCGRAAVSKGLLDHARAQQTALLDALAADVAAGATVVGVEPSCILTLRDELPDLVRDPRARALAEATRTFEELLVESGWRPGRLARTAIVHGHCHQKALVGMKPTTELLSRVEGLDFTVLDSGCCGMAGSFGYEAGHYEVSRAIGERVLLPAVRAAAPETLVIASGFSCRGQIEEFVPGARPLHLAEVLAMAEG